MIESRLTQVYTQSKRDFGMGFFTWKQIIEVQENAGDFAGEIGKSTARGLCNLYGKYPNSWILSPFGKGLFGSVCPRIGANDLPVVGSPPFSGGQCAIAYKIGGYAKSTIWEKFGGNCPGRVTGPAYLTAKAGNILGPILSITWQVGGPSQACNSVADGYSTAAMRVTTSAGTFSFGNTGPGQWRGPRPNNYDECAPTITAPASSYYWRGAILETGYYIVPLSGTDNCGDPPGELPPDPPRDPSDFQSNITINNYYGDGDPNNNSFTFPVIYAPINGTLEMPVTVDVGGIDVNVDVGGIEVNFGSGEDTEKPPKSTPKLPPGQKNLPLPKAPYVEPKPPRSVDDSGLPVEEIVDPQEEIVWALIEITKVPEGGRRDIVFAADSADNVYFAGYFQWLAEDGIRMGEAIPVRKKLQYFPSPDGAVGYTAYTTNGAILSVELLVVDNSDDT